jgi:hypothetical protein
MEEWETRVGLGMAIGILLMLLILVVDVGLIWLATQQSVPGIGSFAIGLTVVGSLGLEAMLGYWLYGLVDSGYFLDRNALIIHWGAMEQIVPMGQVERVVTGDEIRGRVSASGGLWPGHFVGFGTTPGLGESLFYATARPRGQIFVVTPGLAYGISPADPEDFLQSLRRRLEMGPTQVVEQSSRRPRVLEWPIWRDTPGLALLGVSLLSLLVLTGAMFLVFPALPSSVPLHFAASGQPDRFAPRAYVFAIPVIGLVVLVANTFLGWALSSRERLAGYLAWAGALFVQVLIWVPAVRILSRR